MRYFIADILYRYTIDVGFIGIIMMTAGLIRAFGMSTAIGSTVTFFGGVLVGAALHTWRTK